MKRWMVGLLAVALVLVFTSAQAEDQFFDSNGVQIRYVVEGEGEPVILVHGFTATLDLNWRMPGIINGLTGDYQVIGMDCRGHGKSGKPHAADQYGMEMVEDVVRLMDHLGIEKAHVAGYSMGGFITAKLLTVHPERLLTATLGGAGWSQDDDGFSELRHALAESLEAGDGLGPLIAGLTPAGRPQPTAEQMSQINTMLMMSNDAQALAAVIRGMDGLGITRAQLEANGVPTLALIGEVDPLRAGVDSMAEAMNGLRVVVIEERDHMTAFPDPKFLVSMREFLGQHNSKALSEGSDSKEGSDHKGHE